MEKILIIEDDIWISQSLKLYLENSNFEVLLHHEWGNAIKVIKKNKPWYNNTRYKPSRKRLNRYM